MALRLQFLTASRVSEIVGQNGIKPEACQVATYENHPVAIFSIRTAKKKRALIRAAAIPLEHRYEPWTREVVDYIKQREPDQPAFALTTRMMEKHGARAFQDLYYPIEEYVNDGKVVQGHVRNISTHGLRHLRATELMMYYGFDGMDLAVFCGWSLGGQPGMPRVSGRYLHMQWSRYITKLLKPLPSAV